MSSVFVADEAALMGFDLHFDDDDLLFHSYTVLAAAAAAAADDVVVREPAYDFDRLSTKRKGCGIEDMILPPPGEMQQEEGFILQDWRRQNTTVLEEKERKEKEIQKEIIVEAEDYKLAFHEKEKLNSETNKMQNREREKLFLANQENFHANADKQYWKTIAELIPRERPSIEKKGKKEHEKKLSLSVMQGPKPGKPTDLSRMREILLKLKHSPVSHVKLTPPSPAAAGKESIGYVSTSVAATPV